MAKTAITSLSDTSCRELADELQSLIKEDRNIYRRDDIQLALANEFGRRQGWRLVVSGLRFSLGQLARRSNQPKRYEKEAEELGIPYLDHPYFYRDSANPYRPVGIAVHLYELPSDWDKVEAACRANGVTSTVVSDFPSWWFPGYTSLVVYRPLDEMKNPAGKDDTGGASGLKESADEQQKQYSARRGTG